MSRPQIFLCHCLACFYFRVDVVSPHSFKHLGKQARPFSFQKTSCSFFCCDLEILSILIIFVFSVFEGRPCLLHSSYDNNNNNNNNCDQWLN